MGLKGLSVTTGKVEVNDYYTFSVKKMKAVFLRWPLSTKTKGNIIYKYKMS